MQASPAVERRNALALFRPTLAEGNLIDGGERAELADDQCLFEGGEDRLDGGGLEQAGGLPLEESGTGRIGDTILISCREFDYSTIVVRGIESRNAKSPGRRGCHRMLQRVAPL